MDKKERVPCEAHIDPQNSQQVPREEVLLEEATPVYLSEAEIYVNSPAVVETEPDAVEPVEVLLNEATPEVVDQEEIVVRMTSQGGLSIQQHEEVILEDVYPEEIILYVVYF
jgi:hypothetical protein